MIAHRDSNVNSNFNEVDKSHFHPDHWNDLKRSTLTDDTISRAGFRSVPPCDIQKTIGSYLAKRVDSVLEIPYNHNSNFSRLKLFSSTGSPIFKYFQTKGSKSHLYYPPNSVDRIENSDEDLCFCEGEKKSLAMWQRGYCAAGISGCHSWKDSFSLDIKLLDDFDRIPLDGRPVVVIPDSDFETNLSVRSGYLYFANLLLQRGARVWFVIVPEKDGLKQGVDDFLYHDGDLDSLLSSKIRVDLDFLRREEFNFHRLKALNDGLEDILNGVSREGECRIDTIQILLKHLFDTDDKPAHVCKTYHGVNIFIKGDNAWLDTQHENTLSCPACAFEWGRERLMEIALKFPLGFWYLIMPKDESHNSIRRRISEKGIGGKIISKTEKRKIIISSVSVDPAMKWIEWSDTGIMELFRRFLFYEPGWGKKQHKYDAFGKKKKEQGATSKKPCESDEGDKLICIRVKAEPNQVKESLVRMDCKENNTGGFKLSKSAKNFFNFISGRSQKIPIVNLPYDDPLWRAKVLRS